MHWQFIILNCLEKSKWTISEEPEFPIPEFLVGDKVLVRNHTRDVWDPKFDVAYHVACDIALQLVLADKSVTWKVNVHDVKIAYSVDELIKCLPMRKLLDTWLNIMYIQN